MAYVGLRKPIIAAYIGNKTYGDPFAFGKAIGLQVTPNYAEGSLNADDEQSEYDKEFNYAETTLNTNTIPLIAHEIMFGHAIDKEKRSVTYNKDDQANFVGQGWVSVEKVDGKRAFVGNILYKAKYSEPAEDYATKGDSIEYKTPSISGRAISDDDGDWKDTQTFETVAEALNWIYEKFGKIMETLTVQSAAGQNAGETTITVTEEKDEDNSRFYRTGKNVTLPAYNDICNATKGWKAWNGTEAIKAKTGDKIVIVEVDTETSEARKAGIATVTAKETVAAKETVTVEETE